MTRQSQAAQNRDAAARAIAAAQEAEAIAADPRTPPTQAARERVFAAQMRDNAAQLLRFAQYFQSRDNPSARNNGDPTQRRKRDVQAVIVPRTEATTAAQAAKIATQYVAISMAKITVDAGPQAWHVRVHQPGLYDPHSFRTTKLATGIGLVYGTRRAH